MLVPPDPEGDIVRGRGTVDGDEMLVNETGETTTPKEEEGTETVVRWETLVAPELAPPVGGCLVRVDLRDSQNTILCGRASSTPPIPFLSLLPFGLHIVTCKALLCLLSVL